ncbi:MAG: hypothetical protein AAGH87_09800 [Pseudomonadota bacterium]
MIRYISLAFVLAAAPAAFAQDAPPAPAETGTTDQSEEDWRRSQRKGDTDDTDPFSNPTTIGSGMNFPEPRELDTLPEDSRRHLNQQMAQVLANADLENLGAQDVAYEPSEAAKSDQALKRSEEAAWEEMMGDVLGGSSSGSGDTAQAGGMAGDGSGSGQSGEAGESGQGSARGVRMAGVSTAGGAARQGQSTMGGGANQSAADILRQMSGRAGSGGASPQGEAPGDAGEAAGQAPNAGDGALPAASTATSGDSAQAAAQARAQADAQAQAQAQAQADAQAQTGAEVPASAEAASSPQQGAGSPATDGANGDEASQASAARASERAAEVAENETEAASDAAAAVETAAAETNPQTNTGEPDAQIGGEATAPAQGSAGPGADQTRLRWLEVIGTAMGREDAPFDADVIPDPPQEADQADNATPGGIRARWDVLRGG